MSPGARHPRIERENIDAEPEKPFEQPLAMLPPVAFGDTEAHLEQGGRLASRLWCLRATVPRACGEATDRARSKSE